MHVAPLNVAAIKPPACLRRSNPTPTLKRFRSEFGGTRRFTRRSTELLPSAESQNGSARRFQVDGEPAISLALSASHLHVVLELLLWRMRQGGGPPIIFTVRQIKSIVFGIWALEVRVHAKRAYRVPHAERPARIACQYEYMPIIRMHAHTARMPIRMHANNTNACPHCMHANTVACQYDCMPMPRAGRSYPPSPPLQLPFPTHLNMHHYSTPTSHHPPPPASPPFGCPFLTTLRESAR